MSTTATASGTISPMVETAFDQLRTVAPGRLGLHVRGRLPHIADAFIAQDGSVVAGVSVIGGSMQEVVSLAAAFDPEVLAWTGPAASSKQDAPMQYMTVATQKGTLRTVQSSVPFVRDAQAGKVTMNNTSVPVKRAPAEAAAALTGATWVNFDAAGATQQATDRQGSVGMILYSGTSIAATLSEVLYRQHGWTMTTDGSVVNSAGSVDDQVHLLRGLSVRTTPGAFREAMARGTVAA